MSVFIEYAFIFKINNKKSHYNSASGYKKPYKVTQFQTFTIVETHI